jgi:hypothetical protein
MWSLTAHRPGKGDRAADCREGQIYLPPACSEVLWNTSVHGLLGRHLSHLPGSSWPSPETTKSTGVRVPMSRIQSGL